MTTSTFEPRTNGEQLWSQLIAWLRDAQVSPGILDALTAAKVVRYVPEEWLVVAIENPAVREVIVEGWRLTIGEARQAVCPSVRLTLKAS